MSIPPSPPQRREGFLAILFRVRFTLVDVLFAGLFYALLGANRPTEALLVWAAYIAIAVTRTVALFRRGRAK